MTADDDETRKEYERIGKAVIANAIKDSNFNRDLFRPSKELPLWWIIIPTFLYLLICVLFLWTELSPKLFILSFIVGLLVLGWLSCSIHLRFYTKFVSITVGVVAFVGLAIAAGIATPKEVMDKVEKAVKSDS